MAESFDVFISYAHADHDWVEVLAGNLNDLGVDAFFDEWYIAAGDILAHKLDDGILNSRNGILVVSPESLSRPWVREEYDAMLTRAVAGQQKLIPVLLKDAELPAFLASRVWVDFRSAQGPDYFARVDELVRALKGPPGPPPRGQLKPPPGDGFQAQGNPERRLRIEPGKTGWSGGATPAEGEPPGDRGLAQALWQWDAARRQGAGEPARGGTGPGLETALAEAGERLGRAYLPEPVAAAIAADLAEAGRLGHRLDLGLEIADPGLRELPWEILRLPLDSTAWTGPLALRPELDLYRRQPTAGPAPAVSIPGPLRILVAIGSPEAQNARGELLDMEAETARILDALDEPRRAGRAQVRILENGSLPAIRAALDRQRFHVLYLSCHAAPGVLILEDEQGREARVTAEQLRREALPPGRGVPLLVLAGCSTGQEGGAGEAELPSLARELVEHGVPSVIAMQGPVSDRYATELAGLLFEFLGEWEEPRVLPALAEARRRLERQRLNDPRRPAPEWPLPTLHSAGRSLALFDPKAPFEDLKPPPEPVLDKDLVVRRVGEFVGRRRELRLALRALRDPNQAGVLIHGMGGVGKSALAAQLLHRRGQEGALLVSVAGPAEPDRILDAVAGRLLSLSLAQGLPENHPYRQLVPLLRELKIEWRDRLNLLREHVLEKLPLTLLLDNFEDNLDPERRPSSDALGRFLAEWLEAPGLSRVIFTCRYPYTLPDRAESRLEALHLGPLSPAETRKLSLRLEGLRDLPAAELRQAHAAIGGHPRALEYLDALLRGGKARFFDVEQRLRAALKKKGIADPGRWCAGLDGNLDTALAETVTLAADDVLLDELLQRLEGEDLALRLLLGTAVYREPVDTLGLAFQVGEDREPDEENPWPVTMPEGLGEAVALLESLSLLAPVRHSDEEDLRHAVHRWTAAALARRHPERQAAAQLRAARYWDFRVRRWPQPPAQDVADMLEARHHYHEAGEIGPASEFTGYACLQLETWGAWSQEEDLLRETLAWVPEDSAEAAKASGHLGILAHNRGDYDAALEWYRKSLAIAEALGDRAMMAKSYHQLGMVAEERGDYDAALDWYRKSLAIAEALDDRAGMASSFHELGIVAQMRGDYDAALEWYRKSLAIAEVLGDRAMMAISYHQLGMVDQDRGDYDAALEGYRKSLAIAEALDDRAMMASSYHQLGRVAEERGDYDAALDWYRKSLAIAEALGDRAGIAKSYHQLGMVDQNRGDYDAALDWYRKSLEIKEALGDRAGMASSYHQLGNVANLQGDYDAALEGYRKSLEIFEALGNRAGMARSYHQLGNVAYLQGDYDAALEGYRKSLSIEEALGDRAGMVGSYHQLGMVAENRGDYDTALDWYRKSLVIAEALGDRAGMAGSYHQLGMVAENRGDYDAALEWYRKSLAIAEALGDRAGMAGSISQIGVLYTQTGRAEEALPLNLRSLVLRIEMQSPEIRIDLHWLNRQREILGAARFETLLRQHLDPESAAAVLGGLDRYAQANPPPDPAEPPAAPNPAPPPAPPPGGAG